MGTADAPVDFHAIEADCSYGPFALLGLHIACVIY